MQIRENISLKPYHTFGIDVCTKYFASFSSLEELKEILDSPFSICNSQLVLGGGSNVLFTQNFDGIVLKNEMMGIEVVKEDETFVYVKSGAGESWHRLVMFCVNNNYAGMENLSLIPGNVGASPMQNIGAYGVEIKDIFFQLEAYHLQSNVTRTFSVEDCAFGYRESVFKRQYKGQFVITSVTFRLRKQPVFNITYGAIQQELYKMGVKELTIQAVSQAVINIRSSKLPHPKEIGNAGSFFKNPTVSTADWERIKMTHPNVVAFPLINDKVKLAAGWLIEQCGWKGYRKGDAGCYPLQALVLVNYGKASGNEIYSLSEDIIQSVSEKFSVVLEREVNII